MDYNEIRAVTAQMHQVISSGTFDSPSWDLVRTSKLAARIYAPLGTAMTLGDFVRLTRTFLEVFKSSGSKPQIEDVEVKKLDEDRKALCRDLKVDHQDYLLQAHLIRSQAYQDQLARWGIKDDRIRRPLPRHIILRRMLLRLTWSLCLFTISIPGLMLWLPI